MVLYFVWIRMPGYYPLALLQAHIVKMLLYLVTTLAVCMAFWKLTTLGYYQNHSSKLIDILLILCQAAVYFFLFFILISSHITLMGIFRMDTIGTLICAGLEALQSTLQTLFLLNAKRRRASKAKHARLKPGSELLIFLLVCNLNLWVVDSIDIWRLQLHPLPHRFYGMWSVRISFG